MKFVIIEELLKIIRTNNLFMSYCFHVRYARDINAVLNGPRQANLVLIAYASREGSGEPEHPRSFARTSAARSYKP